MLAVWCLASGVLCFVCLLFVVCGLPRVGCWLSVVRCVLSVVCWPLFGGRFFLFLFLSLFICCLTVAVPSMLFVMCFGCLVFDVLVAVVC